MKKRKNKIKEKKIEKLAEFEHNQWLEWIKTCKSKGALSKEYINRISNLLRPYKRLPETEKNKDRVFAKKEIALIKNIILK